jgi:glycine/D-amino acid oxidase-like deaminating enzyme
LPASARTAYPRLPATSDVPVVIVGGGLAGAAAAYAFSAAGIRVALVEAGRVGGAGTAACAGHVLAEPAGDYLDHEARYGRRVARALWQSTRRASLELQAAVKRLKLKCGLEPFDAVTWARGTDEVRRLRREQQSRQAAGLEASWIPRRALAALGLDADGGLRTHGHAHLDPLRACLGFARAAASRGALVFEKSPVTRVTFDATGVRITSGKATIAAETVILATGEPIAPFAALERHFESRDAYSVVTPPVAAVVRKAASDRGAILADLHEPTHRLTWLADERILWTGGDQARTPERTRDKVVVQRTGGGRPAVRRPAPQLPAPPLRLGARHQRGLGVPREPHPAPALHGPGRQRRRGLRFRAAGRSVGIALAGLKPCPTREEPCPTQG